MRHRWVRKCRQLFTSTEEFLPPTREIDEVLAENNAQSPQAPCKCCQGGKSGLATWCITYDTQDQWERLNFDQHLKGPEAFLALHDIREHLRQLYKYEEYGEEAAGLLEKIRSEIYSICEGLPEVL